MTGNGILKEEGKREMMKIGSGDGDDNTGSIESGSTADDSVLLRMNKATIECMGTGESFIW